jgi:hypothetical protein
MRFKPGRVPSIDEMKPLGRRCRQCVLDNSTLEFQQHYIERPTDAPGTATFGTLWKCRACQHAVFLADDHQPLIPPTDAGRTRLRLRPPGSIEQFIEDIYKELDVQLTRMGQIQQQVDELRGKVRGLTKPKG